MASTVLVAAMKDEGPYLLEWLAYHKALGFDQIVVASNNCSDMTDKMLDRIEELGLCIHIHNEVPEGRAPHSSALKYARARPELHEADYIMVLDADEFLIVKFGDRQLQDLVTRMDENAWDCHVSSWRLFGSGGLQFFEDKPVLQRFQHCSDPRNREGVKTLFRNRPEIRPAIHMPKPLKKNQTPFIDSSELTWVNGSGEKINPKGITWKSKEFGRDLTEIAHFMVKSVDEYIFKIFRGDGLLNKSRHGLGYWQNADQNDCSDLDLSHARHLMRPVYDKLMTDPQLAAYHSKALALRYERLNVIYSRSAAIELRDLLLKSSRTGLGPNEETAVAQVMQKLYE